MGLWINRLIQSGDTVKACALGGPRCRVGRGPLDSGPMRGTLSILAVVLLCLVAVAAGAQSTSIILATTTSTDNSGLLDELLPVFEERTGIEVKAVAVGTGAALRMASKGQADVVLTHAPSAEKPLVRRGTSSKGDASCTTISFCWARQTTRPVLV